MSTARSIAFHTLGCKLNFSETSSIGKIFRNAGYEEVEFDQEADYYVINTCSVTDEADKKCRYAVRKSLRKNPMAKVIVIGCYAQLKPEEISSIPGVSLVLGAAEKFNILKHINELDEFGTTGAIAGPVSDANIFIPTYSIEDRTRTFLKVQDGCDYKCSFCTIPLARGKSRSGTIEEIVKLAYQIGDQACKEIVLTGVNLGDFGQGTEVIEGHRSKKEALFIDLIASLDEVSTISRFRISSIEPNLCNDEIIEFVAQSKRFMPHFHIPLQSGDNEILSLMKRRYKRELYESRVSKIKSVMPHACIGVDVIVGFPGETEEHFLNTFQFLENLDVSYLHVFTYSERDNTPAALMNNIVPVHQRHKRNEMLRNLSEQKRRAFYKSQLGSKRPILWEREVRNGQMSGFTDNYVKVYTNSNPTLCNTIQEIHLSEIDIEGYFRI
ncbi:MAG: tRNA (N(6)-L-threonylcarbamoyladenosine(37)-C(2))-methylthiotransferase MtaB [Saprospiraceae bacterium]|nr:tRNA (N(6)-L-threonylcarbamoyladenosine(37)-C(2))-methylthiotransferase MtaB [Saprospiraceae bacterium]